MQLDLYKALLFVIESAKSKRPLSDSFLKEIASYVMRNTGAVYNTALGSFDSSKGDFRLLNVRAGTTQFIDHSKVAGMIDSFCNEINNKVAQIKSVDDALITSFDAHFNVVSIHPFADGNGRVSQLVMNYIQYLFGLPLSSVFKEYKAEYYKALIDTREFENIEIFRTFMVMQYEKMITDEIRKVTSAHQEHHMGISKNSIFKACSF